LEQWAGGVSSQVVDHERKPRLAHETRHRRTHVAKADETYPHRVLLSCQSAPGFSGSNPSGRRIIIVTSTTPTRICCAAASRTPVRNGITSLANRLPSRRPSSTSEPRSAPRLLPLPPRMSASQTERLSCGGKKVRLTTAISGVE